MTKKLPEKPTGRVEKALRNWRMFIANVGKLSEKQLVQLLDYEASTKRRKMIMQRAGMRLRKIRNIKDRSRMEKLLS